MSDTPRTDAQVRKENPIGVPGNTAVIATDFARQLERELAAERALADRLGTELSWLGWLAGHERPNSAELSLQAWKEARRAQA